VQAVSRLQFYRKAYGRINDDGEADLAEQKKIVTDFFLGSKVQLDWPDTHTDASGVSVSYKMGRLLLNLIILASGSLLRGGTLAIRIGKSDAGKSVSVIGTGTAIKWDTEVDQALGGHILLADLTPKTAQAELTRWLAREIGATLSVEANGTTISITAQQPRDDVAAAPGG
jgi:histidine phosphotransferase ChpT